MADGTGLENRKGFTLLVGSNPTPSAFYWKLKTRLIFFEVVRKMEASPSPVHGTRLLSGRGIKPPRGFKSLRLRQVSNVRNRAPVAQRIEHLTTDQKVRGSNPFGRASESKSIGTIRYR